MSALAGQQQGGSDFDVNLFTTRNNNSVTNLNQPHQAACQPTHWQQSKPLRDLYLGYRQIPIIP